MEVDEWGSLNAALERNPFKKERLSPALLSCFAAPDLLGVSAAQLKEFEDNGEQHRLAHALQV